MSIKFRIHRWRVVLLSIVILILVIPYGLSLATHYVNSNSNETIEFKGQAPVFVAVTVRRAMYVGSSYDVVVQLTAVSRFFNPEMFEESTAYRNYATNVLTKARCKLDAPDFSVVEVEPKSPVKSFTILEQRGAYTPDIWECSFVVSPKISGSPMLLVSVTNISGFDSAHVFDKHPLFVPEPTRLHDMHLPLNVTVDERLSLTTISAPLAIIVALAGLFIKGKSDNDEVRGVAPSEN